VIEFLTFSETNSYPTQLPIFLQVEEWRFHYAKASTALTDRVGMVRNIATLVENNLTLLGATGVEDKLQVTFQSTDCGSVYLCNYLYMSHSCWVLSSLTLMLQP